MAWFDIVFMPSTLKASRIGINAWNTTNISSLIHTRKRVAYVYKINLAIPFHGTEILLSDIYICNCTMPCCAEYTGGNISKSAYILIVCHFDRNSH